MTVYNLEFVGVCHYGDIVFENTVQEGEHHQIAEHNELNCIWVMNDSRILPSNSSHKFWCGETEISLLLCKRL